MSDTAATPRQAATPLTCKVTPVAAVAAPARKDMTGTEPVTPEQWHALVVELLHAIAVQLDDAARALRRAGL